ncbi:MAG: helicase-associated domain-containing protein [Anaerolineales bacterium]|nr:helicase-associated domain-containing protein [Anaerolineales bacterium]
MPDLSHSLQSRDLGYLRIVAELWGVELLSNDAGEALTELAAALLDPNLLRELVESLSPEARAALEALVTEGGRIPWATFARRFGQIREVGAGHRDREQVYLHPISAAEMLFYRALLARAFFDTPSGPQEFAYIPEDLISLLSTGKFNREEGKRKEKTFATFAVNSGEEPPGRAATPTERAQVILADDRILDHACTLLAALRLGIQPPELSVPTIVLIELLAAAKLIGGGSINPEAVKSFLEMPRAEALASLVEAWQESGTFDELRQLPGLVCEGEWTNSSLVTRHSLLDLLATIPHNQWWSLPAFIRAIKEKHPDFQRPAGDYDSWFIRRESDNTYLRGFEHWDEVDGALIRYFITGPLHWLGMTDLASAEDGGIATAFRIKSKVEGQMSDFRPSTSDETGKLHVSSQGKITIPRYSPRAARYQIARFCEWEEPAKDEYRYRVTPVSLQRARQQKLKPDQLLSLLRKHAAAPLPPPFVRAIQRWEINGTEARLEHPVVLRLASPAVLDELRKSKAGRFLGEILGPTTVIVKSGAQAKVLAALAELGYLAEDR